MVMKGTLSTGLCWKIAESRKRAPGLVEGKHLVLTLEGDPSIEQLGGLWTEVLAVAHDYAMKQTAHTFNFRIAYNGSGVGTRKHALVHIMLPQGRDKLSPLVER